MTVTVRPEGVIFEERLRGLRQKRGHTLQALAEIAGTPFAYMPLKVSRSRCVRGGFAHKSPQGISTTAF